MLKLIRIAALAVISLAGAANAYAAAGDSLVDCYNIVIASCNQGNHPQSCTEGGMDECDKIHPTPMVFDPAFGLTSAPRTGATAANNLKQIGIAIR